MRPRTTRAPFVREDGWVVHFCCECDVEITDPIWQRRKPEDDPRILCIPCTDKVREQERRDASWWV